MVTTFPPGGIGHSTIVMKKNMQAQLGQFDTNATQCQAHRMNRPAGRSQALWRHDGVQSSGSMADETTERVSGRNLISSLASVNWPIYVGSNGVLKAGKKQN